MLDLFAGTGALGIEAISRGASTAVFVERDGAAARVLEANLAALEIPAERFPGPPHGGPRRPAGSTRGKETYDLVFIDPPYGRAGELGDELSRLLPPVLSPGARIVVESDRRAPLELAARVERERRYGDTSITIHRHQ